MMGRSKGGSYRDMSEPCILVSYCYSLTNYNKFSDLTQICYLTVLEVRNR